MVRTTWHISFRIKILLIASLLLIIGAIAGQQYNQYGTTIPTKIKAGSIRKDIPVSLRVPPQLLPQDEAPVPQQVIEATRVKPKVYKDPDGITASAYLVGNLNTGKIYLSRDVNRVFPIASISKLITALTARDLFASSSLITIDEAMLLPYGDAGHLVLGEHLTSDELIYPLLLESSNDAAEALARGYGYTDFIAHMNGLAQEIGMTKTSFGDPSGLSPQNTSNARDLFTLAQYLYRFDPSLLATTTLQAYSLATSTDHGAHVFTNINPFSYDPHLIGGKTGRTEFAQETMLSLFHYPIGGIDYPIAIVVLHSDFGARQVDSAILFEKFIEKMSVVN